MEDLRPYIDVKNPPKTRKGDTPVLYDLYVPNTKYPIHGRVGSLNTTWVMDGSFECGISGGDLDLMIEVPPVAKWPLWQPQPHEHFYKLDGEGIIRRYDPPTGSWAARAADIGNIFRTEQEAMLHLQARKDKVAIQRLLLTTFPVKDSDRVRYLSFDGSWFHEKLITPFPFQVIGYDGVYSSVHALGLSPERLKMAFTV